MRNITRHFGFLFVLFTTLLIGTSSFSTNKSALKEFTIEFESTRNSLKLTGLKGTAFKELSFTLRDNVLQGVDEFGMTMKDAEAFSNDDNLADFEFTVKRVNKEYILVGKRGTGWSKLTFTFSKNNKVIVDQNGVTLK